MPLAPRDRFFGAFVTLGRRRPGVVVGLLVLLFLAGLFVGRNIDLNTSRLDMVRPDDPYQAQLIRFFDRFGHPDAPVLMIQGGDAEKRREVVDHLTDAYEADPMFEGRVLGRIGAGQVAEVLLVQQPDAIAQLRASLPPDADVAAILEGGLPTMVGAIEQQLLAGLDGEVEVNAGDTAQGMKRLANLARMLDDHLAGKDTSKYLEEFAGERATPPAESGLDDEGYLVSSDGSYHLVAVFPDMPGTRVEDYKPVVARVREIRDAVAADVEGVKILVTGLPVLVVDEEEVLQRGIWQSGIASGVGVVLLLLLAFRSIRSTIYALVPLTLAMGMTLGVVYVIYGHLNPITAGIFAMLLGLGIDFSVHLLARFQELIRRGSSRADAIQGAVVHAGPGVLTGALTSALAFLTVVTATFTAFSEYGVNSALGLLIVFLTTMLLLPIMLERFGGGSAAPEVPGISLLPRVARKAPIPLVVCALLMAAGGVYGATQVRFNPRYFDYLPEELESVEALEVLENDGAMNPLFAYASAPDVEEARALVNELRELESVYAVQTPTDLLPPLDEARITTLRAGFEGIDKDPDFAKLAARQPSAAELAKRIGGVVDALDELRFALEQGGRPTAEVEDARTAFVALKDTVGGLPEDGQQMLARTEAALADTLGRAWKTGRAIAERGKYEATDLPSLFQHRYVSRDGEGAIAVYVFPAKPIWYGGEAERFATQVRSVDPAASGHAISMHIHNEMILGDFVRAALLAAGIVFVVLYLDFRRLSDTLLALAPVLLGGSWMVGFMLVLGLDLSVANVMVLPFLIGLGIDAGVHMVHRARQSTEEHGVARLSDLVAGTGAAVLVASVTTIVGFGGLMLADYGALYYFGLTMVVGVTCSLVATVLVLPAILLVLGQAE